MPACVSGYASAAAFSFGIAALSFCASVENVPFAPIVAAAGASPGLVDAVTGTTAVFRTTIACASRSWPCLFTVPVGHDADDGCRKHGDRNDGARNVLAVLLGE